jgi:hypothetical protein
VQGEGLLARTDRLAVPAERHLAEADGVERVRLPRLVAGRPVQLVRLSQVTPR